MSKNEKKLKGGLIPAGETCPYSDWCAFRKIACNGEGCMVASGKVCDKPFSCGIARLFDITGTEGMEKID